MAFSRWIAVTGRTLDGGVPDDGFFLEWLTGKDPVLRKFINRFRDRFPWIFDKAMKHIFGEQVTTDSLWEEYQAFLKK